MHRKRVFQYREAARGVDILEKVLEKLATTEKSTLVVARELDGKE
jgi:hypothetical protein